MIGECTGKIRSTPTPSEILRTVKVAPVPPPFMAITIPWKIWMRSFSPSLTFTCTFTESPTRKAGGVPFISFCSISFTKSMAPLLLFLAGSVFLHRRRPAGSAGLQEVGSFAGRLFEGSGLAPRGDSFVVARQQNLGDL